MKGVFLDSATLGKDISFDPFHKLPVEWTLYSETHPQNTYERIQDAKIVISNKVVLNKEILQKCQQLKLICVAATGYNNIDLKTAKELKIAVCNVPGYSTESVVQWVMTYVLALATNLISYVDDVKEGKWQNQSQFCLLTYPIFELKSKKLGIVGYGNLGKQIASLAKSFGMQILIASHSDPSKKQEGTLPLEHVLAESDFLTLHVPLTTQTQNLIKRAEIEKMKPTAFLINTARGGIVNEKDLAECLKEKRIAGAAIDVLTKEPPKEENPLLDPLIPNLLLTPHIGWASFESRCRLVKVIEENIQGFLQGSPRNLL